MDIRAIILLFLGLVIQLSQVRPMQDAPQAKPCAALMTATTCCGGPKTCHCIDENESSQKPAPVLPAATDLKFSFVALSGTDAVPTPATAPSQVIFLSKPVAGIRSAYSGVPLTVAFCSFVI